MRRLIMWNLVTLDGFFEGTTGWDLGWHLSTWGPELEQLSVEQLQAADMIIFGRVTYEGMAQYWPSAKETPAELMNGIPKVVFSSTLETAGWNNTRLVKSDAAAEIAKLKQQPGKDMFVFGSANLSASLIEHGLFDEYRLCVAPVLLGDGQPLFKTGSGLRELKLLEARPLQTGGVILRYEPMCQ